MRTDTSPPAAQGPEPQRGAPAPREPRPAPAPRPAQGSGGHGAAGSPDEEASARRKRLGLLAAGALLLPAGGWLIWQFLSGEAKDPPPRSVAQITLVRPPPPPPPPPKPPEKPPEPPKIKETVKVEPPKPVEQPKEAEAPKAAEPPPGPLGVDAQGTGSADGFGLQGRPGGRPVTEGPPVVGGPSAAQRLNHSMFANGVARHIAQELARLGPLRGFEYRVVINIWVDRDGRIERHEISQGSGDAELDRLLQENLNRIAALRQPVPEGMRQPLRIRVTSADA